MKWITSQHNYDSSHCFFLPARLHFEQYECVENIIPYGCTKRETGKSVNNISSAMQQSIQHKKNFNAHAMQIVQQYRLGLPQGKYLEKSGFLYILGGIGLVVVLGLFKLMYVSLYTGMPVFT